MDPLSKPRSLPEPAATAAIIHCSDDAIIGLTLDGIITSWNPSAERLYGYTADEIVGYRLHTIVPEELWPFVQSRLTKVRRGAPHRVSDLPRLRKDGQRRVVSSGMFPVRDDRQNVASIALIERDITEERALQALLLQAKRTETVGRLAAGVAQEFNNINTAILGLVEFVEQEVCAVPGALADLREIARQATRGARLSQQLLAFGRRGPGTAGRVDAGNTVRSLETLLQRLVGEGIWLTVDQHETNLTVMASEGELELLLFELVLQACDELVDRGSITVSVRRAVVDDEMVPSAAGVPIGEYVVIAVRNAGSQPSARRDAQSQDDSSLADSGDALRLALVLSVVQRLGGYVSSTPHPGDGSETSIFLPLAAVSLEDSIPAPDASPAHGGTETILLVEDEAAVRAVLGRSLRQWGYQVLEAVDGEDALDVVAAYRAPIHLVVSDVIMPRLNGAELFERLRAWYPNLRFLLISGYTRGAVAAEHLGGPSTTFLAKPFALPQLASAVRALLDRTSEPRQQTESNG